jgi:hypothetical protein
LEAIGRFVEASEQIRFESEDRGQQHGWVERGAGLGRSMRSRARLARGLLRRYIERVTGLSPAPRIASIAST